MEAAGSALIVALGAILLAIGGRRLWQYRVITSWPTTTGTLLKVSVGSARERIKYSDISYVYPVASYQYAVQGCHYQSDRLCLDPKSSWLPTELAAFAPWKDWKPGTTVTVHFDKVPPTSSVLFPALHPRRRSHFLAMVLAGVLLILTGGAVAVIGG